MPRTGSVASRTVVLYDEAARFSSIDAFFAQTRKLSVEKYDVRCSPHHHTPDAAVASCLFRQVCRCPYRIRAKRSGADFMVDLDRSNWEHNHERGSREAVAPGIPTEKMPKLERSDGDSRNYDSALEDDAASEGEEGGGAEYDQTAETAESEFAVRKESVTVPDSRWQLTFPGRSSPLRRPKSVINSRISTRGTSPLPSPTPSSLASLASAPVGASPYTDHCIATDARADGDAPSKLSLDLWETAAPSCPPRSFITLTTPTRNCWPIRRGDLSFAARSFSLLLQSWIERCACLDCEVVRDLVGADTFYPRRIRRVWS